MTLKAFLPAIILTLAACDAAVIQDTTSTSETAQRGSIAKADLVGSCTDSCGAQSGSGTCWCDDICTQYGDCCADFEAVCGEQPPVGKVCGGFGGFTCGTGEYCAFDKEDTCGFADALGTCKPKPEVCTLIFKPVCGCDGQTYGNDCEAAGAGTSVLHDGACEPQGKMCGGFPALQCGAGEYCDYELEDICGAADATGTCKPLPELCTAIFHQVCGCDGQTYSNDCQANAAGTSVAHDGACEPQVKQCGGFAGLSCGTGEYCAFEQEDSCGFADALGTCQPKPEVCILIFKPVCGCDGVTYGNDCQAAAAGASVFHQGSCN